jgi:hypothetical protein
LSGSHVVAEEPIIDLGSIGPLSPVRVNIALKNTGPEPANLGPIKVSCSCALVGEEPNFILPGSSVVFPVEFNPWGKKGREEVSVEVPVLTEADKVVKVEILADISDQLKLKPMGVNIEGYLGQTELSSTLSISAIPEGFQVEHIEAPEYFTISPPTLTRETGQIEIAFRLNRPMPIGEHLKPLLVSTNHPNQTLIRLTSRVWIRPTLQIDPMTLVWKNQQPEAQPKAIVSRYDMKPFKISTTSSHTGRYRAEFSNVEAVAHEITFFQSDPKEASLLYDTIRLVGDENEGEWVSIPVIAYPDAH